MRRAVTTTISCYTDERTMPASEKERLVETLAQEIGFDLAAFRERRIMHLMTPAEVGEMSAGGIDVQMHTHRHWMPKDEQLVVREIADNRERIEKITCHTPTHFCYPSGVYYPELLSWLRKLNIRSATTCDLGLASAADDPLLLPRFLDHAGVSQVEFEAWAAGVAAVLPRRSLARIA
jgi:Polysaccharide deacetylase